MSALFKYQFVFWVVLAVIDVTSCSPPQADKKCRPGANNPRCRFNMDDFTKHLYKLKIKHQILAKLGLSEIPTPRPARKEERTLDTKKRENVTISPTPIKFNVTKLLVLSTASENYTNKNIIKFQPQFVFSDESSEEAGKMKIKSANLLIKVKRKRKSKSFRTNKKPLTDSMGDGTTPKTKKRRRRREKPISLTVSTVDESGKPDKKVAMVKTRVTKSKWFNVTLPSSLIQTMIDQSQSSLLLHIKCRRCRKNAEIILVHGSRRRRRHLKKHRKGKSLRKSKLNKSRPFIVLVAFRESAASRVKRTAQRSRESQTPLCSGSSAKGKCCREPIYFNFTDVGWGDFILAPEGFETAECRGDCYSGGSENTRSMITGDTKKKCLPYQSLPLSVLYDTGVGSPFVKTLADMVVTNCECARS
ncbi:inhibin beta A chain [Patella vulgata]|uniref:inhibin beta A chain n=1 Tax=Patella vulgata TaxID=6465 RepID=UPI00217FA37D|nr:inhibin beta A chain [Patella vulgata]